MSEVDAANERLSQAMLDNYTTTEEPAGGGLIATQTIVHVAYNDLRIVLAYVDECRAALTNGGDNA